MDIPPPARELTEEEQAKIESLQQEIDEIWSKKGNYQIDDDAWMQMPIFMESIGPEDVEKNPGCAALSDIVYNSMPPEETAVKCKENGNKYLQMALTPDQEKKDNISRAAIAFYNEGLVAQCNNRVLNAQLYANRSMANYVLQNFGHGLQDAQKAILMDATYHKAYYRGAKNAEKIKKLEVAKNLIEKGLAVEPKLQDVAFEEFVALQKSIETQLKAQAAKGKQEKIKTRVDAAESNNLIRDLQTKGVKISSKAEMSSEQMNQLGGLKKPYFDTVGILHTPLLFCYDEYQTTDFLQDVQSDCSLREILEEEMMPFPFDEGRNRYGKVEDLALVFKIDDGVAMPKYFLIDPDWQMFEVFRSKEYWMPCFVPTVHIVPKESDICKQWGLTF